MRVKILLTTLLIVSACANFTNRQPDINFSQVISQVCPPVEAINSQLLLASDMSEKNRDDLVRADAMVKNVCMSSSTINITNLQQLETIGIPLLESVLINSPVNETAQGQSLLLGLNVAKVLLPQITASAK